MLVLDTMFLNQSNVETCLRSFKNVWVNILIGKQILESMAWHLLIPTLDLAPR